MDKKEEYTKIKGWDATLEPCPFCGSPAELWEFTLAGNSSKSAMCSNEECEMYMSNNDFHKSTKNEARNAWNKRTVL